MCLVGVVHLKSEMEIKEMIIVRKNATGRSEVNSINTV